MIKSSNLKTKFNDNVYDYLIVAALVLTVIYFLLRALHSSEIVDNLSRMRAHESMVSFIVAAVSTITFGFVGKALHIKSSNDNFDFSEQKSKLSDSAGSSWMAAAFFCWLINSIFDQIITINLSIDIQLMAKSCLSTLNNMFLLFAVGEIKFLSLDNYPNWWKNKINTWFRKKKNIILTTIVFLLIEVTLGLAFQNVKYISRIPDNIYSGITVFFLIKYLTITFQKRKFLHFDKFAIIVLSIGFIVQFKEYFTSEKYITINEYLSVLGLVFHICLPFVLIMWLTSWWKERTTNQKLKLEKQKKDLYDANKALTNQQEELKSTNEELSKQSVELVARKNHLKNMISALESVIDDNKEKKINDWIDICSQYFRAATSQDYVFFVMVKEKKENILKRFAHYENGEKIGYDETFSFSKNLNDPSPNFGVDCFRKRKVLYFKTSKEQDLYIRNNYLNRKLTVEIKRCDQSIYWPIIYPFEKVEYINKAEIQNETTLNLNDGRKILGVISYQQNGEISEEQIRMLNQYSQLFGKQLYDEYYKNDPYEFVKNILRLDNVEDLHEFASNKKLPKQYELLKDLFLITEENLNDYFFGLKKNQTTDTNIQFWAEDHIVNESFKGIQDKKITLLMAFIACSAAVERICNDKKIECPKHLKNEIYKLTKNESLKPNKMIHTFSRKINIVKNPSCSVDEAFNQIYKFITVICLNKDKTKCDLLSAKIAKNNSYLEITLKKSPEDIQNIIKKIKSSENVDLTNLQGDFATAYFKLKKTLEENFYYTTLKSNITFIFKN